MKRKVTTLLVILLVIMLTVTAHGIEIDGFGSYVEWKNAKQYTMISAAEDSHCNITFASVSILARQSQSTLYVLVKANTRAISQDNTAVGVIIRINGGSDIRYSAGETSFDGYKYFLDGAFAVGAADSYSIEVMTGFMAVGTRLNMVSLQLIDEDGNASIIKSYDLNEETSTETTVGRTEVRETTSKVTTAKATSVKKTTVEKTTITKSTTQKKPAASKNSTTERTIKPSKASRTTTAKAKETKKKADSAVKTTVPKVITPETSLKSTFTEMSVFPSAGDYTEMVTESSLIGATSMQESDPREVLNVGLTDAEQASEAVKLADKAEKRKLTGNIISGVLITAAVCVAAFGYKFPKKKAEDSSEGSDETKPDETGTDEKKKGKRVEVKQVKKTQKPK